MLNNIVECHANPDTIKWTQNTNDLTTKENITWFDFHNITGLHFQKTFTALRSDPFSLDEP